MKKSQVKDLKAGRWVRLKDGRKGRFQRYYDYSLTEYPPVTVSIEQENGYGRNFNFWPNQIIETI